MKLNDLVTSINRIILSIMLITTGASLPGQDITNQQWQDDLAHLQKVVHNDYPFLFKKITQKDWDELVNDFHNQIPELAPHEIVVGFAKIVAAFKYGHTSAIMSSTHIPHHRIPVNFYSFSDGLYIQGTREAYGNVLGAKVLAVEGVPIDQALDKIKPAFPTENDQFYRAYGLSYLTNCEILHAQGVTSSLQNQITFTLEKDGQTFDQSFQAEDSLSIPTSYGFVQTGDGWLDIRNAGKTPLYLKDLDKIYTYEYLPEHKLLYVRQSQIQDDPEQAIPEFYDQVFQFIEDNDVEKFVLDVRLNSGGNNYKNKPVVTGIIKSEKINQIGKFFTIIGRRTFSACQNLVNELDNYTNVIFVGEPTGENINFYGDNNRLTLPNSNMTVRLSFAWWQDKPQWENGPWTAPHLTVEPTFEDYRKNIDPVLQTIIDFDQKDFIVDPMSHFTNLFMAGNIDQLKTDAINMVNDPIYSFFDFEGEFNSAGYNLMNRGQIQEAIFVFQMVTDLFPESANAWDSLAEGYWKAGELDKAKNYYKKAMDMDPDGRIGNNARSNLKKIAQEEKH